MKYIKFFSFEIAFYTILYLAFIQNNEIFYNLAHGIVWFFIFLSLFCLSDEMAKRMSEKVNELVVPPSVQVGNSIFKSMIFISFGSFVTGGFYIIAAFIFGMCQAKAKEIAIHGDKNIPSANISPYS